ncbi:sensor histidine kinase [Actinoplanes sp. NPDC020271]|uniref:sensor histidine kinase n=1 Tax=Actinoplanes sp. NPDC020271 TaxID=3363896 RepID=UPI003793C77F
MHGWGQWYAVAAALVIVGGHLCGRRGRTGLVVVLLCGIEVAAAITVARGQDTVAWLVDQAVVVLAVFATLTGAYRRLRQEFAEQGWAQARAARLRERTRIAADLHDTLGHDLTLLSLQAAGIQVTAPDQDTRERAAQLRAGSAAAIETVRRIVDLLDGDRDADAGAGAVLDRARAAGLTVEVTGRPPDDVFLARLVAEALSNAARHAPGAEVAVTFGGRRVEVVNALTAPGEPGRTGTGLAALSARLEQAGGSLAAGPADGTFRLVADVPPGIGDEVAGYDTGRRRVRRMLAGTIVIPGAALLVVATGFYTWAVRDAAMEQRTFDALRVGMPQATARTLLPGRESPIRPGDGPGCHYYTDGNYPLAYGNYVICFDGGRITRLRDTTGRTG